MESSFRVKRLCSTAAAQTMALHNGANQTCVLQDWHLLLEETRHPKLQLGGTLQPERSAWTVNSAAVVNLEPPTKSKTGSLLTVRDPSSCQCFCCVSLIVKVLVPVTQY